MLSPFKLLHRNRGASVYNNNHILRRPFDFQTHKDNFINYLEVVIYEDGLIEYAVPSHQMKLISIACKKLSITEEQLNNMCPPEYYLDFMNWLCLISNTVCVWNDFYRGNLNEKQRDVLFQLKNEGLYSGMI